MSVGRIAAIAAVWTLAVASGCGDDSAGMCVELPDQCTPQFAPTFEQIYANVISTSCSVTGSACHSPEGAQAGLVFPQNDPDAAFDSLVGEGRVIPGQPECSEMVRRVASGDAGVVMPPGAPLADSVQCVIVQWIAAGAQR